MIRAPRLAALLLLVLMQILAPWVHAHTGMERGGFGHLPGLEFLHETSDGYTPADTGHDWIVGVQAGKWDRADASTRVSPAPEFPALPPKAFSIPAEPPMSRARAMEVPPPSAPPRRHSGGPRAPPLHSVLH